jgi:hypothetical protein
MSDLHDLLEGARRRAPEPAFSLENLRRRRSRRDRARRAEALVVGLAVATVGFGVTFAMLREPGSEIADGTHQTVAEETLPPATAPALVAGTGEFYYRAVLLASEGCLDAPAGGICGATGNHLDATFWWARDDSGRIQVDARDGYGITEGRFGPGEYPNVQGIDASDFPQSTTELTAFLLERSAPDGTSPAPMVTPPPDGDPNDGQLWRAIADLLQDEHTTPELQAALLDVAASLTGTTVDLTADDPAGRRAYVVQMASGDGNSIDRLYVDPATHGLLAYTTLSRTSDGYRIFLVQQAGITDSIETAPNPESGPFELTLLSVDDLTRRFAEGEG